VKLAKLEPVLTGKVLEMTIQLILETFPQPIQDAIKEATHKFGPIYISPSKGYTKWELTTSSK